MSFRYITITSETNKQKLKKRDYDLLNKNRIRQNKTYYKYVDVVVYTENGDARYMEKLPASKSQMMDVVFMMNERKNGKVLNVEVKETSYRLKEKWTV